nr:methionine aminopeptidase 2-like [Penaeus vannamei]
MELVFVSTSAPEAEEGGSSATKKKNKKKKKASGEGGSEEGENKAGLVNGTADLADKMKKTEKLVFVDIGTGILMSIIHNFIQYYLFGLYYKKQKEEEEEPGTGGETEEIEEPKEEEEEEASAKNKKNKNKKKKKAPGQEVEMEEEEPVAKEEGPKVQTDPPTVPIVDLYPDGNLPIGEICEYKINKDDRSAINRMNSDEKKALETSFEEMYREIRIGAEVHRTVSNSCSLKI